MRRGKSKLGLVVLGSILLTALPLLSFGEEVSIKIEGGEDRIVDVPKEIASELNPECSRPYVIMTLEREFRVSVYFGCSGRFVEVYYLLNSQRCLPVACTKDVYVGYKAFINDLGVWRMVPEAEAMEWLKHGFFYY